MSSPTAPVWYDDDAAFLSVQTFILYLEHNNGGAALQPPTDDQIRDFDPNDPDALANELGMKHLGHTDLDEDIEGDEEGGDSEARGTRQKPNLRERVEPVIDYFTVTPVQVSPHVLDLYHGPGGTREAGRYTLPPQSGASGTICTVLIIDVDSVNGNLGEWIPKVSIRRGGPIRREGENFRGYPLRFTPLSSNAGIVMINEKLFAEPLLDAPTGLSGGTATSTTVPGLTWSAVTGAARYQVQRSTNGTTWTDVASGSGGQPTTPPTTISSLTSGTVYHFRVAGVRSDGQVGNYSTAIQKTTT